MVDAPHGRFLAPDNGLLTYMVREHSPDLPSADEPFAAVRAPLPSGWVAVALTNPDYWKHPVSATFHGRDIFAPVAAHRAKGVSSAELGDQVSSLTVLHVPHLVEEERGLRGLVLHTDRFGNLVTNVPGDMLQARRLRVHVGAAVVEGLDITYGVGKGLVALIGSHGYLEIAIAGGSAAEILGVEVGAPVRLVLSDE